MDLTRRQTMMLGLGAAIAATLPRSAMADMDAVAEAIKAFTGGAEVASGGVDIGAPEIAENGNTVPVSVGAEGASDILILAAGNPNPGVATFHFGALAGSSEAKTRIRLATTQDLIAVAKLSDGSYAQANRSVKVTIGGCGG